MTDRIALIHATPVAMEPIVAAFRAGWPEAGLMNVLDDSLSADRAQSPDLTPAMYARFELLARYTVDQGAAAILFTCSAFGPAIEAAAATVRVPVLKPNEAMFDAALASGDRIGMVATFAPSVATMAEEFDQAAARAGSRARLETIVAEGAMDALRAGDAATHNARVAEMAARLSGVDAIMLAQFSTSRALEAVRARVHVPVLTAPDAAVAKLRKALGR
jgi:Asp/Glu/hydantoin racemase